MENKLYETGTLIETIENEVNINSNHLNLESLQALSHKITNIKKLCVSLNIPDFSKALWCYETITSILYKYTYIFALFKEKQFYLAWCELEKIEIALASLKKHLSIEGNVCNLEFIEESVYDLQKLFPYRIFVSHESIYREIECSICKQRISIRKPCGHIVGEIYDGEICGRHILRADLLAIAFTENPVHKYAVCNISYDQESKLIDNYNYELIEGFFKIVTSPNDSWKMETNVLSLPHENFIDFAPNDYCPCGSAEKYSACCLNKQGVKHVKYIIHLIQ